jgi:hypothetical protein
MREVSVQWQVCYSNSYDSEQLAMAADNWCKVSAELSKGCLQLAGGLVPSVLGKMHAARLVH